MPPELDVFPYEVQVAFLIHSLMPDRWDGMSGSYMGKDWSCLGSLLDIYEVEDKREITYFLKAYQVDLKFHFHFLLQCFTGAKSLVFLAMVKLVSALIFSHLQIEQLCKISRFNSSIGLQLRICNQNHVAKS